MLNQAWVTRLDLSQTVSRTPRGIQNNRHPFNARQIKRQERPSRHQAILFGFKQRDRIPLAPAFYNTDALCDRLALCWTQFFVVSLLTIIFNVASFLTIIDFPRELNLRSPIFDSRLTTHLNFTSILSAKQNVQKLVRLHWSTRLSLLGSTFIRH